MFHYHDYYLSILRTSTYITELFFFIRPENNISKLLKWDVLKDKIIKICIHRIKHIAHLFFSKWIHIYRLHIIFKPVQWCESVYKKTDPSISPEDLILYWFEKYIFCPCQNYIKLINVNCVFKVCCENRSSSVSRLIFTWCS